MTAHEMKWETLRNGVLLKAAADAGFGAFIAADKKLEFEQNLKALPLPVIVLGVVSNSLEGVLPFAPLVLKLVAGSLNKRMYFIEETGNVIELHEPRKRA